MRATPARRATASIENGSAVGLALAALAWGLVITAVGFAQQRILSGDAHWIVRVAHLVIGLAAMPIAERLARPNDTTA